ncbi:hypothetical protein K1719_013258 [Acacia pycnantha]|nr:hypothetical protein K1719_013258 [Acacia pycnantha]
MAAQSVFYHLYNQVSHMSLDQISPLTFSIGNTMKRISIIVSSIIIFHKPVQPVNALGAAIAILGTFLYSEKNEGLRHCKFRRQVKRRTSDDLNRERQRKMMEPQAWDLLDKALEIRERK